MIKVKTGNKEVLESGSLLIRKDESIDFIINESSENYLKIRILFEDDEKIQGQEMDGKIISNNELEIKLYNFSKGKHPGISEPSLIGKFVDRKLYLLFRVSVINNNSYIFYYTWLLGEVD